MKKKKKNVNINRFYGLFLTCDEINDLLVEGLNFKGTP